MDTAILLAFPLLLVLSPSYAVCPCKLPHPQTVYCESDVVMVAHLLKEGAVDKKTRAFKVNVTKIYKGPLKANEIEEIYTPRRDVDCGYRIWYNHQRYILIAGFLREGKIHFTKCHYVYSWGRLSLEQQLGLETYYHKACKCRVHPCLVCWEPCDEPDVRECFWKQKTCQYGYYEGEHSMTSMCISSKTGQCQWTTIPIKGSSNPTPD